MFSVSSKGYQPGKNGKGTGTSSPVNKPGFSGCFICGDMNHDYKNCPKRANGSSSSSGHQKGGKMIGFIDLDDGAEDDAVLMVEDSETTETPETQEDFLDDLMPHVQIAKEAFTSDIPVHQRLQYAVVDTGATETVGSLEALEVVMNERSKRFPNEQVHVDPNLKKMFRFGNAETRHAESLVYLPQRFGGFETFLGVHALDVPQIPVLLGIRSLRRLGAIIDTRKDTIEFSRILPGVDIPLVQGKNGHLLLNLVDDWVPSQMDVGPGQTLWTTPQPGVKISEPNALQVNTDEPQLPNDMLSLSRDVAKHDEESRNIACAQTALVAQDSSSKTSPGVTSPEVSSHGAEQHVQDDDGREDPCQGSEVEGQGRVMECSVGLESPRRSGLAGPKNQGMPAMQWHPHTGEDGSRKQVGMQCPWNVDGVHVLQPQAVVHTSRRGKSHLQVGWSAGHRCDGDHPGAGRECSAGAPCHQEGGHRCGRTIPTQEAREDPKGETGHGHEEWHRDSEDPGCAHEHTSSQEDDKARECRTAGGDRQRLGQSDTYGVTSTYSVMDEIERPTTVRQMSDADVFLLEQSLRIACEEIECSLMALPSSQADLIEVCCGPDSTLTATIQQKGGTAERVGLHNDMNMTTEKGFKRARSLCETFRPRYLWLSPICGPTSPIQHLNEKTEEQKRKLEQKRKVSRKMARNCITLAEDQLARGGHIVWEWPKGNEGWFFKEVSKFFEKLQKNGLCHEAVLHGCMVGVVAPDCGIAMKKPWRIRTTDPNLAKVLSIPCNGKHEHVECLGHNRAAASAFYPIKMCRLVARHVLTEGTNMLFPVFGNEEEKPKENPELEMPPMSTKELKDLKGVIHQLHVRSGHPTNSALVNCLKARGVPKHVLEIAKEHTCDSCHEVRLAKPHGKVSLQKCETLWHTVQMDIGQLKIGKSVLHFLMVMDEASHFAVAGELFRHHEDDSRNATTEEIIKLFETVWVQYHGFPNVLRCDLEGAFRGHNFSLWSQERGVELSFVPGEDHEQIGEVERMIGKIKQDVRTYLRDVDVDPYLAVVHMVHAHNSLDRIGGFAPCQWAYGRFPTFDGRLFEGGNHYPIQSSEGTKNTDMQTNLSMRVKAEEYYRKSAATARINRAMNSQPRKHEIFVPGDLVYYRRYKTPAQLPSHKDLDVSKVGLSRWYGPGRVLATETKTEEEAGIKRPGHVIWIIAGGRMKRCSPKQLRHCSERERLLAEASGGRIALPWSFTSMLGQLEQKQYDVFDDLAFDESHPMQRPEASTIQPKTPRSRSRVAVRESPQEGNKTPRARSAIRPQQESQERPTISSEGAAPQIKKEGAPTVKSNPSSTSESFDSKRFLSESDYDPSGQLRQVKRQAKSERRPDSTAPSGSTRRSRSHGRDGELQNHPPFVKAQRRAPDVPDPLDDFHMAEPEEEIEDMLYVCVYTVELPETEKEVKQFKRDAATWVTKQMKKGNEVKLDRLPKEEIEKFKEAKQVEVQNWVRETAVRGVSHAIPAHRVVRMRWLLTYKTETGKAKARIIILGFEDPDLLELDRSAPTMSRQSRQLLLSFATIHRWQVLKGDIKGAFLQGQSSEERREIYAWPVEELADALRVPRDQPVQLLKACYGLVNAPSEWYKSVCKAMVEAGFETLVSEPCMWRLREWCYETNQYITIGLAASHVDDFLFSGDDQNGKWQRALSQVYHRFLWSPWEMDQFYHCGVRVSQHSDHTFDLNHAEFCSQIQQVPVASGRNDDDPITEEEASQLRGILGGIQWRAYQTGPQHSVKLGMLQSEISRPTVKTIRAANKLCREVFQSKHVSVRVNQLDVEDVNQVCFIAWSDAAVGNRPNGGSTGGHLIVATSPKMLQGQKTAVNVIAWKSGRLKRIARSSLSAEVQAFSEAEEELMFVRLQWAEMLGKDIPLKTPESVVSLVPAAMVTDARSLYDVVQKGDQNSSGLGLRERYSALELLSVLQRLKMCSTITRWVHSHAQIADALTKPMASSALHRILIEGAWTLIEDPSFTSARRLKAEARKS